MMMRGLGDRLPWFLGALALFLIFSALRLGVADLMCGYASSEMAAWPTGGPDASVVNDVSRVLATARWLAPDNPDIYENLARLDVVRAGMLSGDARQREAVLRDGLAPIRRAIALRPVSPYDWAILLRLKYELREYDAEFRRSLERTVTLGPWEPGLQLVVADAGFGAWAALPDAERRMVGLNVVRGMKRQAATMFAIARARLNDCADAGKEPGCMQ